MSIKIETDRLLLIPISNEYENEILKEFTPEVTKYMPFTPEGDIDDIRQFIGNSMKNFAKGSEIVLVVLKNDDKSFLGCCGIHNISKESSEIGLWLKAEVHGLGFGGEVVSSLINYIDNNLDSVCIIYPVDKDNIASRKLPEKYGFSVVKEYSKKKSEKEKLNIVEYRRVKI